MPPRFAVTVSLGAAGEFDPECVEGGTVEFAVLGEKGDRGSTLVRITEEKKVGRRTCRFACRWPATRKRGLERNQR